MKFSERTIICLEIQLKICCLFTLFLSSKTTFVVRCVDFTYKNKKQKKTLLSVTKTPLSVTKTLFGAAKGSIQCYQSSFKCNEHLYSVSIKCLLSVSSVTRLQYCYISGALTKTVS